jgi:hypothetical protein
MRTPLTPVDLEVLLHHYYKSGEPLENIPAIDDSIRMWSRSGMLEMIKPEHVKEGDGLLSEHKVQIVVPAEYRITVKGCAMVMALCNTPEPRRAWVDEGKRLLWPRPRFQ